MAETSFVDRPSAQLALSGLARAMESLPFPRQQIAVLTYHRVEPLRPGDTMPSTLSVAPDAFRQQMATVARRFNPVPMDAVLDAFAGHEPLPERAVLVTFDDAYECIHQHAWPVLRSMGIPATMFVPTRFPDSGRSFWWDRLHRAVAGAVGEVSILGRSWMLGPQATRDDRRALFVTIRTEVMSSPFDAAMDMVDSVVDQLERNRPFPSNPAPLPAVSSWDDLRSMTDEGLTLGAHTRNHPVLTNIDTDRLDEELVGSLAELRLFAGAHARPVFTYPGGAHDPAVVAAVGRAGFKLAFTTARGVVDAEDADPLLLTRINVGHRTAVNTVRVQLNPITHRVRHFAAISSVRLRKTGPNRGKPTWN